MSRTKNSIKNFVIILGIQILTLALTFANRTFFIRLLSIDYLGINGLFTNILTVLSFAELGIGSAIIYSMYSPVSSNDIKKIISLYGLYKKAYWIITVVVLIIGLIFCPFLKFIIKETPDIDESIHVIYLLFLMNTVCSFCFAYNKSLFTVYQKEYVNVVIERITHLLCVGVQIIILYYSHSYYLYLFAQIMATLLSNVIICIASRKNYNNITCVKPEALEKKEIKTIVENIKSIVCYKVGVVVLSSTSNIVIAKMINITTVGICSNYILIINLLETILFKALNGIVGSIGNLNSSTNIGQKLKSFYELNFIVYWIYGICSIELAIMLNSIIEYWLKDSSYILSSYWTILAMILNFYVIGVNFIPSNFRMTMGYFKLVRWTPCIAVVINIILAIVLEHKIGLLGVFIASPIARIVTFCIVDPIIVLKKGLQVGATLFFMKFFAFTGITLINGIICYWLTKIQIMDGIMGIFVDILIVFISANVIYLLCYCRTREFIEVKKKLLKSSIL